MSEYTHGGDVYSYPNTLLDFSANISPLGLPKSVKTALAASIDSWNGYPDPKCRKLKAELAKHHNVPQSYLSCGNGAAELIYKIAQIIKPRCAMIMAPTFSEYRKALCSAGCEVIDYLLDEKNEFLLTEGIIKALDQPLEMLILCNPNNPTGQPIKPELLDRILEKCFQKNIDVLLDECFIPFLDHADLHTQIGALNRYPNLIVLRAFTKLYAMAGLRLGYLLCSNEEFIQKIESSGQPWSVSTPAQVAGIAALQDTEYVVAVRNVVREERAYLVGALKKMGITVYGSHANYIFFKSKIKNLKERFLKDQILIRSCADYHGLNESFYRISVRGHNENERLIAAFANLIAGEEQI